MSKMKSGILLFPNSIEDSSVKDAAKTATGSEPVIIDWKDTEFPKIDFLIIPGGFAFGDYIQAGYLAARTPIMKEVIKYAKRGGAIIGICNGFQILTQAGLLEGSLITNDNPMFLGGDKVLIVENNKSIFTESYSVGDELLIPIAHKYGKYVSDEETMKKVEGEGMVAFRYKKNPNGSLNDIAGVTSKNGRVLGLMPHPERARGFTQFRGENNFFAHAGINLRMAA